MRFATVLLASATFAAVAGLGYSITAARTASAAAATGQPSSPNKVDDFRLADQNLFGHQLSWMKGDTAIVLITQTDGDPATRAAAPTYQALQKAYGGKNVEFLMLNSNPADKREDIVAEAKTYGFNMPILLDTNQLVGEQLGVTRSGEVIVIDPKSWKIVYRGPVDNARPGQPATAHWAAEALDAVTAGRPVTVAWEKPTGKPIDFPYRDAAARGGVQPAAYSPDISYAKDIAPIIRDKCVTCHEPGGIGPMPLTSYEKIKGFAPMIREVIRTQRMPPYFADPSVGHFKGDERLSADQIKTLVHWVEEGAPRGTGDDPLAKVNFQAPEWPLGKPDLVLNIPSFNIPATGVVDYQYPWVAYPETEGKWLKAATIKAGVRQGVHHILTGYLANQPAPGAQAREGSWGVSVGDYAVGAESTLSAPDTGTYIPPGGAIGFQMHYTPFGKPAVDHSQIGLYFYKTKPKYVMHNSIIANPNIVIPANDPHHVERAYVTFPHDALLYAAFTHAHYRAVSQQLVMQYPDGHQKILLAQPTYDFNWQRAYDFAKPIKVPAGAKIIATYIYDNSKRNPANPDPNKTVMWGEQSFDEMLYTRLRYRWMDETSDHQLPDYDKQLAASSTLGMLDFNVDGKVEKAELKGRMGKMILARFDSLDKNHDGMLEASELSGLGRGGAARQIRTAEATPAKTALAAKTTWKP